MYRRVRIRNAPPQFYIYIIIYAHYQKSGLQVHGNSYRNLNLTSSLSGDSASYSLES
jgi:hypothetical protein